MHPQVLELRIHGVNNTPPHAMLALPEQSVEQFRGDRFGSFWRPKQDALEELPATHPGQHAADVHREAYSWGGMARSTPGAPGSGVASVVANVIGRIGWALLLPFGLANVAYWSRRLPEPIAPAKRDEEPPKIASTMAWWNNGKGAASTRLFGLGLTVLLVLAVCEVSIHMFAIQCSLDPATCRQLPKFFDVLGGAPQATRVLAASLIPVLLLIGLHTLTALSRCRYEMTTASSAPTFRKGVVLSKAAMWRGSPRIGRLTRLHLAAGFATVVLVTGVDQWSRGFWLTTIAAGAVLVLAAGRVVVTAADTPDVPARGRGGLWSWLLMIGSVLVLVAHEIALAYLEGQPFDGELWATQWLPPLITTALLGLAVAAWGWRWEPKGDKPIRWALLASLLLVAGVAGTYWHPVTLLAAGAAVAIVVALVRSQPDRRWRAWGGTGPGVLLGLSLTASVLLSTVLVLTFGSWLGVGDNDLNAPEFYRWFSGSFAGALALVLAIVVLLALQLLRFAAKPKDLDDQTGVPAAMRALVTRWRHVIAVAHRAEPVVGVLSAVSTAAIGLTVCLSFISPSLPDGSLLDRLFDEGVVVTGLAGVSLITSFVGAGFLANRRPLGLLWDLMCFLPRTAHPFAPPCYAERAVPEIADRVRQWLDPEHTGLRSKDRVVVLSAHSLGAVLAVAALYALPGRYLAGVKLLTYGVQLRPYFGRIFPELLGPDVLGIPPCRRSMLWRLDPWCDGDACGVPVPKQNTLSRLMKGRWLNLWRRTDYLGFPIHSWDGNAVDRRANETDGSPDKVETHSDYHLCRSYQEVFDELLARAPQASQ